MLKFKDAFKSLKIKEIVKKEAPKKETLKQEASEKKAPNQEAPNKEFYKSTLKSLNNLYDKIIFNYEKILKSKNENDKKKYSKEVFSNFHSFSLIDSIINFPKELKDKRKIIDNIIKSITDKKFKLFVKKEDDEIFERYQRALFDETIGFNNIENWKKQRNKQDFVDALEFIAYRIGYKNLKPLLNKHIIEYINKNNLDVPEEPKVKFEEIQLKPMDEIKKDNDKMKNYFM